MRYAIVLDIETTGFKSFESRIYSVHNTAVLERPLRNLKKAPAGYETQPDERRIDVLSDSCEVLSVGYIRIDLEEDRIFDAGILYFYRPEFKIENEAQKIHGLTREFLKQYEDKFQENLNLLESLLINSMIIGKNSEYFDIPVIEGFLQKHRGYYPLYTYVNMQGMKNYDKKKLYIVNESSSYDVQTRFAPLYRALMQKVKGVTLPGNKKGKLTDYIALLDPEGKYTQAVVDEVRGLTSGEFVESAHDAMYDAAMTLVAFRFIWAYEKKCAGNN